MEHAWGEMEAGRRDRAERDSARAVDEGGVNPRLWIDRGHILELCGRDADAEDAYRMAIALAPEICTRKSRHYVEVETASELTRGMTVVDALGVADDEQNLAVWGPVVSRGPNVTVCWEIDIPAFKELLYRSLR